MMYEEHYHSFIDLWWIIVPHQRRYDTGGANNDAKKSEFKQ